MILPGTHGGSTLMMFKSSAHDFPNHGVKERMCLKINPRHAEGVLLCRVIWVCEFFSQKALNVMTAL